MIRQFRPGVWVDPDAVVCAVSDTEHVHVAAIIGSHVIHHRIPSDDCAKLADEIGEAARGVQESRLAMDTRFRGEQVDGLQSGGNEP